MTVSECIDVQRIRFAVAAKDQSRLLFEPGLRLNTGAALTGDQRVWILRIDTCLQLPIDFSGWALSAVSQAKHMLQRDCIVGGGFAHAHLQTIFEGAREFTAPGGLAGLAVADADDLVGRLGGSQVGVETDDAAHLGSADVEDVGNNDLGFTIDKPLSVNNSAQGADRAAGLVFELFDECSGNAHKLDMSACPGLAVITRLKTGDRSL